jgi:hypothetical protein
MGLNSSRNMVGSQTTVTEAQRLLEQKSRIPGEFMTYMEMLVNGASTGMERRTQMMAA